MKLTSIFAGNTPRFVTIFALAFAGVFFRANNSRAASGRSETSRKQEYKKHEAQRERYSYDQTDFADENSARQTI